VQLTVLSFTGQALDYELELSEFQNCHSFVATEINNRMLWFNRSKTQV